MENEDEALAEALADVVKAADEVIERSHNQVVGARFGKALNELEDALVRAGVRDLL